MFEPEKFQDALAKRHYKQLRSMLAKLEEADLAELFTKFETGQAIAFFRMVSKKRRAEIFTHFSIDVQEKFLSELPEVVVIALMNEIQPDDRTKILESLSQELSSRILLKLSPDERSLAWQLLSYPDESVGRYMTPEFLALHEKMTVKEAIDYIQWNGSPLEEESLHYLFVTDEDDRYRGEVSLAELILADPQTVKIEDIMHQSYVLVNAREDQEIAVDTFRKYDRAVIPVIDDEAKLVGILTSDDVFDLAEEEATEDIQQFGGQATLEDSYFSTPLLTMVKKRAGWLSVIFIGELFTGTALKYFDDAIMNMRFLVYFVPLIISSGGNSGSQAASLIIRGLAVKEMTLLDWRKVFSREIGMGLILGIILGILGYIRAITWDQDHLVSIIIFLSLVSIVTIGAVVGSMLPFLIKSLKMDPAVSSSPFIASIVDVLGILIYFSVAVTIMRLFGKVSF